MFPMATENIMSETLESKIKKLVQDEHSKMKFSKSKSNQSILADKCQHIVYHEWGIGNNNIWKMIDKYVIELIPDELD